MASGIPELPIDIWHEIFTYLDWKTLNRLSGISNKLYDICSSDKRNRIKIYGHSVMVIKGIYVVIESIFMISVSMASDDYIKFRFRISDTSYSVKIEDEETFIVKCDGKLIGSYYTLRDAISSLNIENKCLRDAFHDLIVKYMNVYEIDS